MALNAGQILPPGTKQQQQQNETKPKKSLKVASGSGQSWSQDFKTKCLIREALIPRLWDHGFVSSKNESGN